MLVAGQFLAASGVPAETAKQHGRAKNAPETVGLAKLPVQVDGEHPDTTPPDGLVTGTVPSTKATWSAADISAARAKCQALLKDRNVVFIQAGPIKESGAHKGKCVRHAGAD
jgi:hypothetical protein